MSHYPGKPGQRWYSGADPAQRAWKLRMVKAALASGEIVPTCTCSVCARTFPYAVGMHSEDYSDRLAVFPVCRQCHFAIHIRFWRPDFWRGYIARLNPDGWFQRLSLDPKAMTRPFNETYPAGLPSSEVADRIPADARAAGKGD